MTASTEPRGGLEYGWDPGEDGWGPAMNANLLRLSRVGFHPSVVSKSTTSPPGSPVSGEGYIVPSGATGAWSGQSGKIAIWDGTAWAYTTPRDGFLVHVADADGLALYDGGAWSADVLRADRLATAYAHSQAGGNPHGTTAAQVGALPTASPTFTGMLSGPNATLSGLSASATRLARIGTGGAIEAGSVSEDFGSLGDATGLRTAFSRPAALVQAGGTWGGSAYTGWTPSAWFPISDDTLGNQMNSLSSGWIWNSQKANALTLVDGAASNPYRGRIKADRWVGVSMVNITGTTSATSWFAAGTGDGSPKIPNNYLKSARRGRIIGRVLTSNCATDTAPQIAIKFGSIVIQTITHAFTTASGLGITVNVDVNFYVDDTGALNVFGDVTFRHASGAWYVYPVAYFYGPFDTTISRTIDITIKPYTTAEIWQRTLAVLEI